MFVNVILAGVLRVPCQRVPWYRSPYATCERCNRVIIKRHDTFYHCCLCLIGSTRELYNQCMSCGPRCIDSRHPQMALTDFRADGARREEGGSARSYSTYSTFFKEKKKNGRPPKDSTYVDAFTDPRYSYDDGDPQYSYNDAFTHPRFHPLTQKATALTLSDL